MFVWFHINVMLSKSSMVKDKITLTAMNASLAAYSICLWLYRPPQSPSSQLLARLLSSGQLVGVGYLVMIHLFVWLLLEAYCAPNYNLSYACLSILRICT